MGNEASGTITIPEDIPTKEEYIAPKIEEVSNDLMPIEEGKPELPKPIEEKKFKIDPEIYRYGNQVIAILGGHDELPPKYGGKINLVKVDKDGYLYCKCEQREVVREGQTETNRPININVKPEIKVDLWQSLKDIYLHIKVFFRRCLHLKG